MAPHRVVITQPTYLPWLGYFNQMACADTFIFLDSVQFEKSSWQQRNRLKGPNGDFWLTVPVLTKGRSRQLIKDVEITDERWTMKHFKTMKYLYAKAPFFRDVIDLFADIYQKRWEKLIDLNLAIIFMLAAKLGLSPRFHLSSELGGKGKKVDLLIQLCEKVGATHYMSGQAAKAYIDQDNRFGNHGITLEYHDFPHPRYPQLHGPFVSHLSMVDAVMNVGWARTRELIDTIRDEI
ncbi:MAG: WbqC family protein [Bacillota bacterium]